MVQPNDVTETELVEMILNEWGASTEITELPYGRSNQTLAAMARKALRGLGLTPQRFDAGMQIPTGVERVFTPEGLDFTRDDPNGDEEHAQRWVLIVSTTELLERFGIVSTDPPDVDDVLAGRIRGSVLPPVIRLADTIDFYPGQSDDNTGKDRTAEALRVLDELRDLIGHVKTTLDEVTTRSQNRHGVPIDLGQRAHTHSRFLDAALSGIDLVEAQLRTWSAEPL